MKHDNYATGSDDPALEEMAWPMPTTYFDECNRALVWGALTRDQAAFVSGVMGAYRELITCNNKTRAIVGAALRRAAKARRKAGL